MYISMSHLCREIDIRTHFFLQFVFKECKFGMNETLLTVIVLIIVVTVLFSEIVPLMTLLKCWKVLQHQQRIFASKNICYY